jgi:outer membrane protein W
MKQPSVSGPLYRVIVAKTAQGYGTNAAPPRFSVLELTRWGFRLDWDYAESDKLGLNSQEAEVRTYYRITVCALALAMAAIVASAQPAQAPTQAPARKDGGAERRFTIEAFGGMSGIGLGPEISGDKLDAALTGGIGLGYYLTNHIQARVDGSLASFGFDGTNSGTVTCERTYLGSSTIYIEICAYPSLYSYDQRYTRELTTQPGFLGGRYVFGRSESKVRPWIEAGVLVSPVKLDYSSTTTRTYRITGVVRTSDTSTSSKGTKIGAAPGLGVDVRLNERLGLSVSGRYHFLTKGVDGDSDYEKLAAISARVGIFVRF